MSVVATNEPRLAPGVLSAPPGDEFILAGIMLATSFFTPGNWRVRGYEVVRAFRTLTGPETVSLFPVARAGAAHLVRGVPGDEGTEDFDGVLFRAELLDFVRAAHPEVKWALNDQRRERMLCGYVDQTLVAIVCEVRP